MVLTILGKQNGEDITVDEVKDMLKTMRQAGRLMYLLQYSISILKCSLNLGQALLPQLI